MSEGVLLTVEEFEALKALIHTLINAIEGLMQCHTDMDGGDDQARCGNVTAAEAALREGRRVRQR